MWFYHLVGKREKKDSENMFLPVQPSFSLPYVSDSNASKENALLEC